MPASFDPQSRRPPPLTKHPRRVRGGVKLSTRDGSVPGAWTAQRLAALAEQTGADLAEALDYARKGQTRRLDLEPGRVRALVQGRAERAYTVSIAIPTVEAERWRTAVSAMADQALYSAKLLAGELPPSIEDLLGPLGITLFPQDLAELRAECTCGHKSPWCKHAACVLFLLADRLAADPFLMFTLRGLPGSDLLEGLRNNRAKEPVSTVPTAVYAQHIPGVSDRQPLPLEDCLDRFWEAGSELDEIDLPLAPPPVSHPLLRRLGPSPFTQGRFPLIGLLATCYDVISRDSLADPDEPGTAAGNRQPPPDDAD